MGRARTREHDGALRDVGGGGSMRWTTVSSNVKLWLPRGIEGQHLLVARDATVACRGPGGAQEGTSSDAALGWRGEGRNRDATVPWAGLRQDGSRDSRTWRLSVEQPQVCDGR